MIHFYFYKIVFMIMLCLFCKYEFPKTLDESGVEVINPLVAPADLQDTMKTVATALGIPANQVGFFVPYTNQTIRNREHDMHIYEVSNLSDFRYRFMCVNVFNICMYVCFYLFFVSPFRIISAN
jgi:hypothetical protein